MGKLLVALGATVALLAIGLAGCVDTVTGVAVTSAADLVLATTARGGPAVPTAWETLDQAAASTCRGLDWAVLAAIGRVESDSGRSTAPGVASGANSAGAEGPMQFEPATFAAYATAGPGGASPPDPYDPVDAVYTAARLLCADGAGRPGGLAAAVAAYNHSAAYVDVVLVLATALGADPSLTAVAASAIGYAAQQLGVPYRWGGTGAGGFDCSGLAQAAYRAAGVSLPRVAQDQYDAGPTVPPSSSVEPGDLLFYGASVTAVDHVGIYIGGGRMIDAPHTGAVVRVEDAGWSDFTGATRPG